MNALINIHEIDRSNMLELLTSFPRQFRNARQVGEAFDFKIELSSLKHVVFAGMGGSAIGGDLIISCLGDELTLPTSVVRHYFLPVYVDQSSLVIVSSYSGNTEESISCYEDARSKRARILCISSGGELAARARKHGTPLITIPGGFPPRTALAYLTIPILVLLKKMGLTSIDPNDFEETERLLSDKASLYSPERTENLPASLAQRLKDKIPIFYSPVEFLQVIGSRWKGQFSENAKILAFQNVFPELNHNEIVGWERRRDLFHNFQIIYFHDRDDHVRIQKRMHITRTILERFTLPIIELSTEGQSRLARLFSLIYLGDMVSYYLAIINGVDPTPVENIQMLKDQLKLAND